MPDTTDRREFLKSAAALSVLAAWPAGCATLPTLPPSPGARAKKPAVIRGAFFYPSQEVVLAGKCEDSWSAQQWSTWPGNQFRPEEQHAKFLGELRRMAAGLDVRLALEEQPLGTNAGVEAFLADIAKTKPDALLLVNFWNTFSAKIRPILDAFQGPIILYHAVGANHQLPPEPFRAAPPHVQYIHSIENWEAIERGLRAVHAKTRLAQSRLLRVSGRLTQEADDRDALLGLPIHGIPAAHFNDLFDATPVTPEMDRLARTVRRAARRVTDLESKAFLDGVRAHATVNALLERHGADAITIECLFLKHRKPCLSFALNNGALVPCGCENDLNASLSLMLGAALFGRGGFQHNPEFDTERNRYFASHCTCTTRLHGPRGPDVVYDLRPFFHQQPKSLALDVQWPAGERATLFKLQTATKTIDAWRGTVVDSPACPPTGGCATRVLLDLDGVADVCSVYAGPHPILYCGDFAKHAKVFARFYGLEIRTNA
ncbi:MAG: hypothetical protein FJ221_06385 [Lentisphaerae bacterium]|nr:hypothetical protein [Lentisphaerota bacterium]